MPASLANGPFVPEVRASRSLVDVLPSRVRRAERGDPEATPGLDQTEPRAQRRGGIGEEEQHEARGDRVEPAVLE